MLRALLSFLFLLKSFCLIVRVVSSTHVHYCGHVHLVVAVQHVAAGVQHDPDVARGHPVRQVAARAAAVRVVHGRHGPGAYLTSIWSLKCGPIIKNSRYNLSSCYCFDYERRELRLTHAHVCPPCCSFRPTSSGWTTCRRPCTGLPSSKSTRRPVPRASATTSFSPDAFTNLFSTLRGTMILLLV